MVKLTYQEKLEQSYDYLSELKGSLCISKNSLSNLEDYKGEYSYAPNIVETNQKIEELLKSVEKDLKQVKQKLTELQKEQQHLAEIKRLADKADLEESEDLSNIEQEHSEIVIGNYNKENTNTFSINRNQREKPPFDTK